MKWALSTAGAIAVTVGLMAWLTAGAPTTAAQQCVSELKGSTQRIGNAVWAAQSTLTRLEQAMYRVEKRQRELLQHAEVTRLDWAAAVTGAERKQ